LTFAFHVSNFRISYAATTFLRTAFVRWLTAAKQPPTVKRNRSSTASIAAICIAHTAALAFWETVMRAFGRQHLKYRSLALRLSTKTASAEKYAMTKMTGHSFVGSHSFQTYENASKVELGKDGRLHSQMVYVVARNAKGSEFAC